MNKIRQQRIIYLLLFIAGLALSMGLVLYALQQNINVFITPNQLMTTKITSNYHFRLGGVVKKDSLKRDKENLKINFIVTDFKNEVPVLYNGILPDLFREGKGVIVEGQMNQQGQFIATQVLAKHDENYMPKSVYEAMRKELNSN